MFDQGSTPVSTRAGKLVKAVTLALTAVLVLAGIASALVAGNVDGVWGNPTPANTSSFRWCYGPDNTTGSGGAPTNCSTSSATIQNPPDSPTTDENQIRYGSPAVGSGSANRSGFGFNGNNSVGTIAADVPFYLGRFTHYNRPITADNVLTQAPLAITLTGIQCDNGSTPAEGSTQTFNYAFTLDETDNNPPGYPGTCPYGDSTGNGCDDKVTVSQQPDTVFTCPEGTRTVQILGFKPGAGCEQSYAPPVTNQFVTGEGLDSPACLWARISDPSNPLAVTLASFNAEPQGDHVLVTWETVSEIQNLGFNLYRSTVEGQVGERINPEMIASMAPGSAQGYAYNFEDATVVPDQTYWYTLEDLSVSGVATTHGQVAATVSAPTAVTLSSLQADSASNMLPTWALAVLALTAGVVGMLAWFRSRVA